MGAAAEFRREFTDLHHAHTLAILLAKERYGFELVNRNIDRHILKRLYARVLQHLAVHQVFDVLQFLLGNRGEV